MLKASEIVNRQARVPEEPMSAPHSLGSSYRYSSQSRKISIGVLVDSIAKAETKEALMQIGGNAPGTGSCVKECEGFAPLVERNVNLLHKETLPRVYTRNRKLRNSSSVAAHDAVQAPSVPATSTGELQFKQPVKAPVNGRCSPKSDKCIQRMFINDPFSVDVAVVVDAKTENNGVSLTKPEASKVNEPVEKENVKIVTNGRDGLRMKLWEILVNVSSPYTIEKHSNAEELHPQKEKDDKHSLLGKRLQFSDTIEKHSNAEELHSQQEKDEKHSLLGKRLQFSDTIESDSEKPDHGSTRLGKKSLTKKASNDNRHKGIEASKPNCPFNQSPKERVFSFREECSAAFANVNDGSLLSKRQKVERESYGVKTNQLQKRKCTEGRQQSSRQLSSNNSKLKASNIPVVHKSETEKVAVSNNRRTNASVAVHSVDKKKISSKCPTKISINLQKDNQPPTEVQIHELVDGQECIKDPLLKNKRNILHDSPAIIFEAKAPGDLPDRIDDLCPAEQLDGRHKRSNVDFVKHTFSSEDDSDNENSMASVHTTDLEKEDNDSPVRDCRESEPLSPEIFLIKKFVSGVESVENQRVVSSCTPGSETVREKRIDNTCELGTYLEQNNEDGLSNAVELLRLALSRIETKLKSMASKRSAEILQATAGNISSQLETAKSRIKLDVEKLTSRAQPKKNILETKFEEQRNQLIKVYENFKKEFDQQLQRYESIFGDLEDHEIELKRTAEKYRAGHKKFLLEAEEEIKVHLDDAESRIVAVHKLAKERLLQLKLALAKFLEDDAFI